MQLHKQNSAKKLKHFFNKAMPYRYDVLRRSSSKVVIVYYKSSRRKYQLPRIFDSLLPLFLHLTDVFEKQYYT